MKRIFLIPSQIPQQELGLIAQVLQSQGFSQQAASERDPKQHALIFHTADKAAVVSIKLFQELGVLRLELMGALALKIASVLEEYLNPLETSKIDEIYDAAQSGMEERIYAVLMVLSFANASAAMQAMRDKYLLNANEATQEGLVQGLAFLETPDVGAALEEIEKKLPETAVAKLARRAIDALADRGLIQESDESLQAKLDAIVDSNPQSVLVSLEKLEEIPVSLRYLHAKALRLMQRPDESLALLQVISLSDPDAMRAFVERALLREQSGYVKEALEDIRRALSLDAEDQEAIQIFERLKLLEQQVGASAQERIEKLNEALAKNQDDPNLLIQRAEVLILAERAKEALADLRLAEKALPTDTRLPALLAEALLAEGILGEALAESHKAQKIFSAKNKLISKLLKPRVFLALNRPRMALPLFREIFNELPVAFVAAFGMALSYEWMGELEKTEQILDHLDRAQAQDFLQILKPRVYEALPFCQAFCGQNLIPVEAAPVYVLDREEVDPLFKRCDNCGALTLKRRTLCKECSNNTFF